MMLGELAGYVKEFKSSLSKDEYQTLIKFFMDFEDVVKEDLEALLKRLDKITGFKR
jgi:predicted phosphoribosyltransferase